MSAYTTVHCSAFSGLFLPKYSSACTFVQLLSGLFLSGLSLPKLLFSLFQCCSSLEFDCLFLFRLFLFLHKYFVLLVPLFSLFQHCSCLECVCCTTVQILSELSMPGIRRLVLMFSLFQGCSYLEFVCLSDCANVQPLSELFLSGIRLLELLFSPV